MSELKRQDPPPPNSEIIPAGFIHHLSGVEPPEGDYHCGVAVLANPIKNGMAIYFECHADALNEQQLDEFLKICDRAFDILTGYKKV